MNLPAKPPRGKQYAVSRLTHVVGGAQPPALVISKQRFDELEHAEKFAAQFDDRLVPQVILVDKE